MLGKMTLPVSQSVGYSAPSPYPALPSSTLYRTTHPLQACQTAALPGVWWVWPWHTTGSTIPADLPPSGSSSLCVSLPLPLEPRLKAGWLTRLLRMASESLRQADGVHRCTPRVAAVPCRCTHMHGQYSGKCLPCGCTGLGRRGAWAQLG